jgi:hypothetical protein
MRHAGIEPATSKGAPLPVADEGATAVVNVGLQAA